MSEVTDMISDTANKAFTNILMSLIPSVIAGLIAGAIVLFIMKAISRHATHISNDAIYTLCKAVFVIVFLIAFYFMYFKVIIPANA
ncbi:MAG: hypothetical protein IKF07_02590 [Eubacterium sp.]|nr:hypothetical protein [Eubacterium sp.]